MVYNPRKLSVVINENIGYLIEREKINKQYIYSNLGIMKIVSRAKDIILKGR